MYRYLAVLVLASAALATAHQTITVTDNDVTYAVTVGFLTEPAYTNQLNGLELLVRRVAHQAHHHHGHGHHGHGHDHHHGTIESETPMRVSIEVLADAKSGYNLTITTEGFTWAPERASTAHVPGEGHGHLYINGAKVARLYGPHFHIPSELLRAGPNEITVTLNANSHEDYVYQGELVAATAVVTVAGTLGHEHHTHEAHHHHDHDHGGEGVAGLERSLIATVIGPDGEGRLELPLRPLPGVSGGYTADLIPTAPGIYTFVIEGFIGALEVDLTIPYEKAVIDDRTIRIP